MINEKIQINYTTIYLLLRTYISHYKSNPVEKHINHILIIPGLDGKNSQNDITANFSFCFGQLLQISLKN